MSCSKQTKTWSAKRSLEEKTYNFVHDLMVSSARMKMSKALVKPEKSTQSANIPTNIAPVPMPPKEELLKRHEPGADLGGYECHSSDSQILSSIYVHKDLTVY